MVRCRVAVVRQYPPQKRNTLCQKKALRLCSVPIPRRTISMRNRGRFFLIALVLALLFIQRAEAHAILVRSTPSAGATLDAAPKALVLEFSEDLDPGFSTVQLLGSSNQV